MPMPVYLAAIGADTLATALMDFDTGRPGPFIEITLWEGRGGVYTMGWNPSHQPFYADGWRGPSAARAAMGVLLGGEPLAERKFS